MGSCKCPRGPMGAPMSGGPLGVLKSPWVPPMVGGPVGVPRVPWVSVRSHGCPHGWESYGCPWGPLGVLEVPWVPPMVGGPMGASMVGGHVGVPRILWVSLRSFGCPHVWGPPGCPLKTPGCSQWLRVPWVSPSSHGCPCGPLTAPHGCRSPGDPKDPWVPPVDVGRMGAPIIGVPWVPLGMGVLCVSPGSPGCPHGWGSCEAPMGVPRVSISSTGSPSGCGSPGCPLSVSGVPWVSPHPWVPQHLSGPLCCHHGPQEAPQFLFGGGPRA